MPAPHRSYFTGRMPFLPPNQQCQSTEQAQNKYYKNNATELKTKQKLQTAKCIRNLGERQ